MAELADAYGSGPYFFTEVQVQVLSGAPDSKNPILVPMGEGVGFFYVLSINFFCKNMPVNARNQLTIYVFCSIIVLTSKGVDCIEKH